MATPFHVAWQIFQCDTETSEHHHWNADSWRQKSAILKNKDTKQKRHHINVNLFFVYAVGLYEKKVSSILTTTLNHEPTIRPIL